MILHDYEKFKIHPDRIMKIEKFIKRNNLDEKYMNKYQDTIL